VTLPAFPVRSLDPLVALSSGTWSDGCRYLVCPCPIGGDTVELHAGGALATQQSLVQLLSYDFVILVCWVNSVILLFFMEDSMILLDTI
jgi:hypothetical protein